MLGVPVQDAAEQELADRMDPLPAQLLNNAAVLSMRGGELHAALALIEEAVQVSTNSTYPPLPRLACHDSRVHET